MNKFAPKICLIYGLQGSGKTTVSYKLYSHFNKKGLKKIKIIDGDDFRKKIKNFRYDEKSRKLVGQKKYKYILSFYKKNFFVITSSVTGHPFIKVKDSNIRIFKVLLTCSEKIRIKRLNLRKNILLSNIKKYKIKYNKKDYDIKISTSIKNLDETLKKILKFFT
tara:strand:- start:284 stop:775 length:492 start_codon:yes stop_codon:yes gene_type:complete